MSFVALAVVVAVIAIVATLATRAIVGELRASHEAASRTRIVALLDLFAAAIADAQRDPRALLVWEPLARTVRTILPDEMAAIERAGGAAFPFSADRVQQAHADWTAEWLAWELAHDAEYKLKISEVEHELAASGGAPFVRAKLDAVEREKLDRYQRRYQEYVRVAKALQALAVAQNGTPASHGAPARNTRPGG